MDHTTVRVRRDMLVMENFVKMRTFVRLLSIQHVTPNLKYVRKITQLASGNVHVKRDIPEVARFVKISMNVNSTLLTVMLTQNVSTHMGHTHANATKVTKEMPPIVQILMNVRQIIHVINKQLVITRSDHTIVLVTLNTSEMDAIVQSDVLRYNVNSILRVTILV
jgi:hypothetical protein